MESRPGLYAISKNLWLALAVFAGFVLGLALAGMHYEAQIRLFTGWAAEHLGIAGLIAFFMLSDFVASPLPPEGVLLIIAKSAMRDKDWLYVPLIGTVSALTGTLTWSLGRKLGRTRVPRALFGETLERGQEFVRRYGPWAVAVGSISPIPYSLTCWSAGMLGLQWRRFFPPCLLRIPRCAISYLAIVYSEQISRWLQG